MKQYLFIALATILVPGVAASQTTTPSPAPRPQAPVQQRPQTTFEVSDYGVDFNADQRLILVMAALEAAGHDPVPAGRAPSTFRTKLRKDLANLDPDLRTRLKTFYDRNKLPAPDLSTQDRVFEAPANPLPSMAAMEITLRWISLPAKAARGTPATRP